MAKQLKLELIVDDKGNVVVKRFSKEAAKGFDQVERKAKSTTSTLKKLGVAVAGIFAVQRLKAWATDWVHHAGEQEQALAALEQAMRSMGRYTPEFFDAMVKHASALQQVTTFGDEAVIAGQKFLMTYKQIPDEVMPRATAAMLDLAALMGGDTKQAANMLGKAAMGLAGELRRVGITIDEDVGKSGDFVAILEQIEQQVGGQARTLAGTKYGGLEQLGNIIGDTKEDLGELVLALIDGFIPVIKRAAGAVGTLADAMTRLLTRQASGVEYLEKERQKLVDRKEMLRTNMAHDSAFADMLKAQGVSIKEVTEQYKAQIAVLEDRIDSYDKMIAHEKRIEAERAKGAGAPPPGGGGVDTALLERYKEAMKGTAREIGAEWALVNQVTAAHRGQIMLMEQAYREGLDTKLLERYKEAMKGTAGGARAEWEAINEVTAAHRGEIMLMEQEYDSLDAKGTSTFGDLKNAVAGWASNFSAQLNDMLWNAETTFKDILRAFAQMVTQMLIQAYVIKPLLGWMGIPLAQGGVIDQGRLLAYARGGIVDRPTIFPMAGGMGLMGEKGPEGVLPLARTPSGDLGVKTTGQPAQTGDVYIILENPVFQDMATQRQVMATIATQIAERVAPGAVVRSYDNDGPIRGRVRSRM